MRFSGRHKFRRGLSKVGCRFVTAVACYAVSMRTAVGTK